MPRKVSLPGTTEIFRATQPGEDVTDEALPSGEDMADEALPSGEDIIGVKPVTRVTGRVRHDEKITVYVSSAELLALESARLHLRADHGIAIDRGRIVRAAIGMALSDLADRGRDSELVKRLHES